MPSCELPGEGGEAGGEAGGVADGHAGAQFPRLTIFFCKLVLNPCSVQWLPKLKQEFRQDEILAFIGDDDCGGGVNFDTNKG